MPQNPYQDALAALIQANQGQTVPLPGAQPDYAHPIDSPAYRAAIAPPVPTDRMKAIAQGFTGSVDTTPEQQQFGAQRTMDLQKLLNAPGGINVERMKMDQQAREAQMLLDAARDPNTAPMTRIQFPGGGSWQTASPAQLDPSGAISKGIETETNQYNQLTNAPSAGDYLKDFLSGIVPGSMAGSLSLEKRKQNLANQIATQSASIGRKPPIAPPTSSAQTMNPHATDPRRSEAQQWLQQNKLPVTEANIQHYLSQ